MRGIYLVYDPIRTDTTASVARELSFKGLPNKRIRFKQPQARVKLTLNRWRDVGSQVAQLRWNTDVVANHLRAENLFQGMAFPASLKIGDAPSKLSHGLGIA